MCLKMWVRLWCHPPFSVILTPPTTHTLTLNVSCYRAQRSSVVYFAMMLSAMWLPPLRGEGNQPFHFQGRGSVQGLTPYFPPVVFKMFQPHSEPKPLFLLVGWLVGWKNNWSCSPVSQQVLPKVHITTSQTITTEQECLLFYPEVTRAGPKVLPRIPNSSQESPTITRFSVHAVGLWIC